MMRVLVPVLAALLAIGGAGPVQSQSAEQRVAWNRPSEPFRLYGNVYYVGTAGLSSFLITGPKGHILIDGALPESAPLIAANIQKLGFALTDVKYLLINHAHVDHAGGLAELKRLTGAKLIASAADKADLEAGETIGRTDISAFPPVRVDRVVRDGGRVRLGPLILTAILTPGHTKGATSWTATTGGKRILFVSSISVAGQPLVDNPDYPAAAADFQKTFRRLGASKADIFVNFHTEGFDFDAKRARLTGGDASAFVNPAELQQSLARARQAFETELARQQTGAN